MGTSDEERGSQVRDEGQACDPPDEQAMREAFNARAKHTLVPFLAMHVWPQGVFTFQSGDDVTLPMTCSK